MFPDWPPLYKLVLCFLIPIAAIVFVVLALTGYGVQKSLAFLVLIPSIPAIMTWYYVDRD